MAGPGSNWWVQQNPFNGASGGATYGGGGSVGTDGITYRGDLDARRSMAGRESQYPDGYLGTITDRHQDKLMQAVKDRLNVRSYQRGVHVGSRIGQEQYYWGPEFNPQSRLEAQAGAVSNGYTFDVPRARPSGDPIEYLAHMGKWDATNPDAQNAAARKYGVDPSKNAAVLQDPTKVARDRKRLPTWSGVTRSG